MTTRRRFLLHVIPAVGAAALLGKTALAAPPKLDTKDPTAIALGYSPDTATVDNKKYPKHTAAQTCHTCQLYTGNTAEPSGTCGAFPAKVVAGKGWCSAYVKRA